MTRSDQRRAFMERANAQGVTLDGERALLMGARDPFVTVQSLTDLARGAVFSWDAAERIVGEGGHFRSK
jgi:hypothetical protein